MLCRVHGQYIGPSLASPDAHILPLLWPVCAVSLIGVGIPLVIGPSRLDGLGRPGQPVAADDQNIFYRDWSATYIPVRKFIL